MKLLVILLCLLSEYFLIHSVSYQRFSWFEHYYLSIKGIIEKNNISINPSIMLVFIVLPITLVVGILYFLLHSLLFGLIGLIINIVIFFYCLGPQNPFYPVTEVNTETSNELYVSSYLAKVNNELFAVIFWYIVGGPIAALVFRLISLSQNINQVEHLATDLTQALEWIPARITVLLYLLVGNFQAGFKRFTHFILMKPNLNNQMLSECGLSALRNNDEEIPMSIAEHLVEHAVIVLVVLLALFTLAACL
jgi:AmpE protein